MKRIKARRILVEVFGYNVRYILLLLALSIPLKAQEKAVFCNSRVFPGGHKEDGMWTAISTASDGKVYIGLSTYENSAHFYIYDPEKDELRHRADLPEILGEKGKGVRANAKIHTPFVEAADGKIYFASGSMGHGPDEFDPRTWEGGHWWLYDPRTDELKDLGLIMPQQGVYALVIDKKRNRLYGTSAWGHFVIYDIRTGKTIDKGRVNNRRTVCRTMTIDDAGNVYGSYEPFHVFRYSPKTDRLEQFAIEIPTNKTIWPVKWRTYRPNWRAVLWDEVSQKIYGIDRTSSILFQYDPMIGKEGEMLALAQLCTEEYLGAQVVPYATLAFTLGKDRKIYFAPVAQPFDYTADVGLIEGNVTGSLHYTHLVSYDLNSGKREYHGVIKAEDGSILLGIGGATTGPNGTIYFCGAVQEKDQKKAAGKVGGHEPFQMRLLMYHPEYN